MVMCPDKLSVNCKKKIPCDRMSRDMQMVRYSSSTPPTGQQIREIGELVKDSLGGIQISYGSIDMHCCYESRKVDGEYHLGRAIYLVMF